MGNKEESVKGKKNESNNFTNELNRAYYVEKHFKINLIKPWIKIEDRKKDQDRVWNRWFKDINGKILDAGCSVGNFISLDPENIIGVDIDKEAMEIAKKRGFNVRYMDLNGKLDFPDNYFSAIHASHVLAHVVDPLFTLKEFRRVLKPEGKLVLFTPNIFKYKFEVFNDYTFKSYFTPKSLKQIAYDAGFRNFTVNQDYKIMSGMGWLVRNTPLRVEHILKIQNLLAVFKITDKDLVLEARK